MSHVRRLATAPLALAALAALLLPSPARADVLLTPFVGVNFGGSARSALADFIGSQSHTTFGGSVAVMGGGIFGVEGDLGYSPRFFGTHLRVAGVPVSLAQNNVLTAMGNLIVGVPLQGHSGTGVRPYGVAGLGLIRQNVSLVDGLVNYGANDLDCDDTSFLVNPGAPEQCNVLDDNCKLASRRCRTVGQIAIPNGIRLFCCWYGVARR